MEVEVMKLSNDYLNALAQQFVFISAFLGGFSAAILGTIIVSQVKNSVSRYMVITTSLAALCFVVTVFGMTSLLIKTTEGYPLTADPDDLMFSRTIAAATFMLGLVAFIASIGLSGWLINKKIGWFTTIISIISFVLILMIS